MLRNIKIILFIVLLNFSGIVFAVEPPNTSDMMDQIRSYVNIDFKQEDAIKPIVEDYATAFKLLQDKFGSEPKVFFVQIVKINQDLDVRLSQILTYDQMQIWKQNKRQILPEVRNTSY